MAEIVNIDDYRPEQVGGPVVVTFIGHRFEFEGQTIQHTVNIPIGDGDAAGLIKVVREQGGLFLPPDDQGRHWFLPWPCASVKLTPVER